MGRRRRVDAERSHIVGFPGGNRLEMAIPAPAQPARDHRRRIERDVLRKCVKTPERKVVGVCVGEKQEVKRGKFRQRNPRRAHPGEEPPERIIKIRVRKDCRPAQTN